MVAGSVRIGIPSLRVPGPGAALSGGPVRTLRVAAATLVAALALTACNGGDDPSDPMSTGTPTATTDTSPTTSPSAAPTEPALPAAAAQATEAGARAFITYYWDLINYAQVTGEVKTLKAVSGPNCERCDAGINGIRSVYEADGHLTDGNYQPSILRMKQIEGSNSDIYAFESKIDLRNDDHVAVDAEGVETPFAASTVAYLVYVLWVDEKWRLEVMDRA